MARRKLFKTFVPITSKNLASVLGPRLSKFVCLVILPTSFIQCLAATDKLSKITVLGEAKSGNYCRSMLIFLSHYVHCPMAHRFLLR
jgi:hypothetical protein